MSQLVLADERRSSHDILLEFLVHGVPFVFPPVVGAAIIGVPTAHSSPAFTGLVESPDKFVWPHADGTARGQSVVPLFPGAPVLPGRNPPLYELVAIVDALRVGTVRVRKIAADLLSARLSALQE